MANPQKISQFDPATLPLTGDEEVPLLQAGPNRRTTVAQIRSGVVRGQVSRMTTGNITIATQGVYVTTGVVATLDTATNLGMVLGTSDQFGLKNTSGATRLFDVYGSMDAKDGNNIILGIKLAKNGVAIDASECRAFTGSGAQEAKLVTRWMVELANNDEVSLMIANHSSASNLELRRGRVVAIEIR